MRRGLRVAAVLAAGWLAAGPALAICDVTYRSQPGDTLGSIAAAHYGDAASWRLLSDANPGLAAASGAAAAVEPGSDVAVPCPPPEPARTGAAPVPDPGALQLLTGGTSVPFTDAGAAGGGMIPELVEAIMAAAPDPLPHVVVWDDDLAAHRARVASTAVDMGFPWPAPDCTADPGGEPCLAFHYSDPLFEVPVQLFVRAEGPVRFDDDGDIEGLRLCRAEGLPVDDLDVGGRDWLASGKVTLARPDSLDGCLVLLMRGEVDAVTDTLFRGADRIHALGLKGQVVALERPVSLQTLHVAVSRRHWRGTTLLYRVNAGLAAIRASGRYDEIVARHLSAFRARLTD
jgi:polar amino acid transport system substrate-binding protein